MNSSILRTMQLMDKPLTIFEQTAKQDMRLQKHESPPMLSSLFVPEQQKFKIDFSFVPQSEEQDVYDSNLNVQQLQQSVIQSTQRYNQTAHYLQESRQNVAHLRDQNLLLTRELDLKSKKLKETQKDRTELSQQNAVLLNDNYALKAEIQKLNQTISAFETQLSQIQQPASTKNLGAEIRAKTLNKENQVLKLANLQLVDENAQLQELNHGLESQNQQLQADSYKIHSFTSENFQLGTALKTMEKQLELFRAENSELKQQIEEQIDENVQVLESYFQFMNRVQNLNQQIKTSVENDSVQQLQELILQITSTYKSNLEQQQEVSIHQSEQNKLNKQLQEKDAEIKLLIVGQEQTLKEIEAKVAETAQTQEKELKQIQEQMKTNYEELKTKTHMKIIQICEQGKEIEKIKEQIYQIRNSAKFEALPEVEEQIQKIITQIAEMCQ
ncbi:Hypothetical_protein [Hexamita inflata]|uniref:Hypothetical_protein n=1 Tax=Hexamita inflata TaxID=28002 RepID=A0AA86NAX8_9EUKA|nr:Hypothetical protein HINF_LOCUS4017 [Hexamita inflata]